MYSRNFTANRAPDSYTRLTSHGCSPSRIVGCMFQEIDDQLQRSLFSEMPLSRWKTNCLSIITQILSLCFVQITFPRLTLLRIQRWNLHGIFRCHNSSVIFEKHSSFKFHKIFVSLLCSSFSFAVVKKCIYRPLYLFSIWKKTRLNYYSNIMMSSFCNTPVVSLQFQADRHRSTTIQQTDIIDHGVPARSNSKLYERPSDTSKKPTQSSFSNW